MVHIERLLLSSVHEKPPYFLWIHSTPFTTTHNLLTSFLLIDMYVESLTNTSHSKITLSVMLKKMLFCLCSSISAGQFLYIVKWYIVLINWSVISHLVVSSLMENYYYYYYY